VIASAFVTYVTRRSTLHSCCHFCCHHSRWHFRVFDFKRARSSQEADQYYNPGGCQGADWGIGDDQGSPTRCLTPSPYNCIVVRMIPPLVALTDAPWPVLPPGVHAASLAEIKTEFATNPRRVRLFAGLLEGLALLLSAGCEKVFLDGSFVSGKEHPGDFDVCWDPAEVDGKKLDPVFRVFDNKRAAQKTRFTGEFFPLSIGQDAGKTFLDFFQVEKATGGRKGIIVVALPGDPLLIRQVQP
jgi:hypothetical protein